jgi:hypothetical protein
MISMVSILTMKFVQERLMRARRWSHTQNMRNQRNKMKIVTLLAAAAILTGAPTIAMSQSSGGGASSGGASSSGSDINPDQMGRGADANPTGINADPMAGNYGNTTQARQGPQGGEYDNGERTNGMNSSNVSGGWDNQNWNTGRGDRRAR